MKLLRVVILAGIAAMVLAACSSGGSGDAPSVEATETEDVAGGPTGEPDDGSDDPPDPADPEPSPDEPVEATVDAPEPTETIAATEESSPSPEPEDEPSPSPSPDDENEGLPAEWEEDSSGDDVPDFVIAELGWDPDEPWCDLSTEIDCPNVGPSGSIGRPGERAVMMMLDSSGSMMDELSDGNKMDMAKDVVEYFTVAIPATTDVGFLVFGHEGSMDPDDQQESCEGVDVLAELGDANHETIPPLLEEFSPTGFTPLALALETAGQAFEGRDGQDNRVLLVSDGLETCDGDPAAEAEALHESGVGLIVDVIAYDVPEDEHDALAEIAEAGGGEFRVADSGEELYDTVTTFLEEGMERAHCVIDEAEARSACVEERGDVLGDAFHAAIDAGGYDAEQERIVHDHVNEVVDEAEERYRDLGEALLSEYCVLVDAEEDLYQRVEAVYGDELEGEEYDTVNERIDRVVDSLGDELDERFGGSGRPNCDPVR